MPNQTLTAMPTEPLETLRVSAFGRTAEGERVRSFLFWLAGQQEPTGYCGSGVLGLCHLNEAHRLAALEVLVWAAANSESAAPIDNILDALSKHFGKPDP